MIYNGLWHGMKLAYGIGERLNKMTTIEARIVLNSAKLAVARFNRNKGNNYKSVIREAWMNGDYQSVGLDDISAKLQQVRNQFGPSWLIKAQPMA